MEKIKKRVNKISLNKLYTNYSMNYITRLNLQTTIHLKNVCGQELCAYIGVDFNFETYTRGIVSILLRAWGETRRVIERE